MFNTKIFDSGLLSGSATAMNIPNLQVAAGDHLNIPQPIDITYQRRQSIFNNLRFRRESIAHLQGMGGVLWGSVTIGLWLKDEVMMYNTAHNGQSSGHLINPRRGLFRMGPGHNAAAAAPQVSMSPPASTASYLPDLEADYCKDYSCCGQLLPTLHDLLRHYEEAHILALPPPDPASHMLASARNRNMNNIHNVMETVSTNDVFLNTHQNPHLHPHGNNLQLPHSHFNLQQQTIQNTGFGNTISNPLQIHNQPSPLPQPQQMQVDPQPQQQQFQQQQQQQQQQPRQQQRQGRQNGAQASEDASEDAMYIDDPARHLYVMENDEYKPFKCPVIGCEKTYKNQNGLKYHRLHGHQNQTLKENPDGTISIIDPESNTPYLDGAGMEKDKPYRCEVCGKRYKNLNGLKYHRGHTTH